MSRQDARFALETAMRTLRDIQPTVRDFHTKARIIEELMPTIETAMGHRSPSIETIIGHAHRLVDHQRLAFHEIDAALHVMQELHKKLGKV